MASLFIKVSKYLFILYILIFLLCGFIAVLRRKITVRQYTTASNIQRLMTLLFNLQSFAIIYMHESGGEKVMVLLRTFGIAYAALLLFLFSMSKMHAGSSKILTNCILMLLSIGIVILWRLRPASCQRQVLWMVLGVVIMNVFMYVFRGKWVEKIPWWVYAGISFILVVLPFIFPSPENGSLNWVNIHGFTFQPSELIKPVLVFLIATLYVKQHRIVSILTGGAVVAGLSVVLLVQNDLGMILIFCTLFLFMTYDYTQREWVLIAGVAAVVLAGFAAYRFVGHVQVRVDTWLNPWQDIENGGYQIAQSLFAISAGRFFGTGLYLGMPYYIPAVWTDMVFSAICEEFGGIFGFAVVMIYLLMAIVIFSLVSRYENRFRRDLAMGCSILVSVQTCLIIGGVIKLLPLTGVTLPFISYGGTSILSTFLIMGIVQELFRSRSQTERQVRDYARKKAERGGDSQGLYVSP